MRIGVFFGSFDPIHIGHLGVISAALDSKLFDQIHIVPAWKNPWKNTTTKYIDRVCMVMSAIPSEWEKTVKVKRYEQILAEVNVFTRSIETWKVIDHIKSVNKGDTISIIVSRETLFEIPEWDKGDEILANNEFVLIDSPSILIGSEQGFVNDHVKEVITMPKTDVSSTYIRKQLKEHKEIYPYVPMEVFNYILKRNLYDGF